MLYHNVMVLSHYRRVVDAGLAGAASAGAWWIGVERGWWDGPSTRAAMTVFAGALPLCFAWLAGRFNVFQARRTEHLRLELALLLEALLYAAGISCMLAQTLTPGLPGPAYAAMLTAAGAALLGTHAVMRLVVRRLRAAGREYRVWLIVGCNERAAILVESILANPHFGVRICRVVDLAGPGPTGAQAGRDRFTRPPLSTVAREQVTGTHAIRQLLEREIVDEVVITLPLRSFYDEIQQLLEVCGDAGVSVKFSPEVFPPRERKTQLQHVGNIPLVTQFTGPGDATQLMAKRAIDVVGAATALLVLAPLMAAIAIALRRGSPGPVLFVQKRVGLHGRQFRMLKFRTMVEDAPELRFELAGRNQADEVAFKIRDDPRVTPLGRTLRRYHLDELPQLWNVLVGDMSLVGPRALPPGEATGSEWWQRRRLSMPPGMTCSWQVAGEHRHRMSFRRWMELDLAYIDNWSLWLDLRLLVQTLLLVPRGSGW